MALNPRNGAGAMSIDTVITATLVRGKHYSYFFPRENRYIKFKRNVPGEVPSDIADELEELVETINTDDGDEIEKPIFEVNRNAERRTDEDERPRRLRMRIVPVDDEPAKPKIVARRTPTPGQGLRRTSSG